MSTSRPPGHEGSIVSVGTFDGVHLGHQYLIDCSRAAGATAGLPVYVVTFDRHPAEIVRPEHAPRLLTGLEHKLELLEASGADQVVVLRFDIARATESAEDFVAEYLVGELGARAIFVGTTFRFGAGARGDVALLEALAEPFGFSAHGVRLVTDDETKTVVSSTSIRAHVADGELDEAARLLGRPHEVRGTLLPERQIVVVHGRFALPPQGTYHVEIAAPGDEGQRVLASFPVVDTPTAEVLVELDAPVVSIGERRPGGAVTLRFV